MGVPWDATVKHYSSWSSNFFLRMKGQWCDIITVLYVLGVHLVSLEACSSRRGEKISSGGSLIFVQEPSKFPPSFVEYGVNNRIVST